MNHSKVEAVAALSPMQEGLLFHSLLDTGKGVYVNQHVITLRGHIEVSLFQQAWRHVVQRHQALRMGFHWENLEKPLLTVSRAVSFDVALLDWTSYTDTAERLKAFLHQDKVREMPLNEAPLMRLSLIRTTDQTWSFYWCNHHLILDGWSAAIVAAEVFEVYEALRADQEPQLPFAPAFTDYLAWLQKQDEAAAESYWRNLLSEYSTPALLPKAKLAKSDIGYRQVSLTLEQTTTAMVESAARSNHVTLSALIQASWGIVISHYCREPDVVFGVTSSGRPATLAGVENMVGLFINTLPVPVRIEPGDTLAGLANRLHKQNLELRCFEYTPLSSIQKWSSLPPSTALFESIIVFENYPVAPVLRTGKGGLEISGVDVIEATNYPLSLVVGPGERLLLQLTFDTTEFDEAFAKRILEHCRIVLEKFASDPHQRLSDLCLLTTEERREMASYQGPDRAYDRERPLHEWIELQAKASPHGDAVIFAGHRLSYSELNARANQMARYLQRKGAGRGTLVGVCLDRSIEMMVALLATLKCGSAYVPLDPQYPMERLAYMLEDAKPAVVISEERFASMLGSSSSGALQIEVDQNAWNQEASGNLNITIHPESPAYVIYTSGSTGKPKGVVNTHRGICNRLLWMQDAFPIDAADRVLQKTPYSFDVSVWEFFWPLMTGACVVMASPGGHRDAAYLAELINQEGVTTLHFVPPMLQAFLDEPNVSRCRSIRRVICSGEALPYELQRLFFSVLPESELHNLYGPTEAAVDVTAWACRQDDLRGLVPIGYPIANTQIHLLSPQLQPVPKGVPGELFIGGAGLASNYLNRPALTSDRFIPDSFSSVPGARLYRTGDLARRLDDGSIDFLGRLDFQVKIRGVRIELGEIEDALKSYPGVRQAVVVAREHTRGDQELLAYLAGETSIDIVQIREQLARRLPGHFMPDRFVVLPEIPLNHNGKIDRRALPDPGERAHSKACVSPRTAMERRLSAVWCAVLGIPAIGVTETFFNVGGNSLLAIRLVARIRSTFDVDLPLRALFESPTVESLANRLQQLPQMEADHSIERADRSLAQPLSFAQERLWFISQLEGIGSAYHIPLHIDLEGPLNIDALDQSLRALVSRHEVLRTSFQAADGRPFQRITDAALEMRTTEEPGAFDSLVAAEIEAPFDLASPPLLRALLIRKTPNRHRLVLTIHHIVADGWSLQIMARDLCSLYESHVSGRVSALPAIHAQSVDHACWQRNRAHDLGPHIDYWKDKLNDAPSLQLPYDFPRPATQSYRGGSFLQTIDAHELTAFASSQKASPFAVLLSGLQVVLANYSGADDFCIGIPVAGRTMEWTHDIVGLFVNTIPLRLRINQDLTFCELVDRTSAALLGAIEHQDLPFEQLLGHLRSERDPSRHPLFQVMAVNQDSLIKAHEVEGLQIKPRDVPSASAKFDLTVSFQDNGDAVQVVWEYAADLFKAETVRRIAVSFTRFLSSAIANGGVKPVRDLSVLDEHEIADVIKYGRGLCKPLFDPPLIHRLFQHQASATPESIAIISDSEQVTYNQLDSWSDSIAAYLLNKGIEPEDRVGLAIQRSPAMIAAMLGILKAGAVYVPIEREWPQPRQNWIIRQTGARVLLIDEPMNTDVVNIQIGSIGRICEEQPYIEAAGTNLVYIMHTSGSTGEPKGVAVPHQAVLRLVQHQHFFEATPDARVLVAAPMAFDASTFEIWMPLLNGLACVLLPPAPVSPEQLRLANERHGANVCWLTAGLFHTIVDESLEAFSGYRQILAGGDALSPRHIRRINAQYPSLQLVNGYGPTENTTFTTCYSDTANLAEEASRVPIGSPVANTDVYILDRDLRCVPIGVKGEIYTGGLGLARGYWQRPDLTAERFLPNPFSNGPGDRIYQTGDLGCWRPDGSIDMIGRIDSQVKIRGHRVEPREVEHHIASHPDVLESVVLVQGSQSDKHLIGYYTPRALDHDNLRAYLANRVPSYLLPSSLIALDALPLTANGKIDRRRLPSPDQQAAQVETQPMSPLEQQIAAVWAGVLGVAEVGPNENFFALGGDSLLCIRVCERARRAGVSIPLVQMLRHQTVRSLAEALDKPEATPTVVEPEDDKAEVPLSPSQHYFLSFHHADPHRYNLAQLFETPLRLHKDDLSRIAEKLVSTHDSLQLRFELRDSKWTARWETDAPPPVAVVDLSALPPTARREAIEEEAERLQSSLHITDGPLFRLVYFDLGHACNGRLLALIHHLAADGTSLWILFDDLAAAIRQIAQGQQVELLQPPISWRQWTRALQQQARSTEFKDSVSFWLDERRRQIGFLPLDFPQGENRQGLETNTVHYCSLEQTQSLLRWAADNKFDLGHVLFGAVAGAVASRASSRLIQIDWIAHGRDSWNGTQDLSRTVGYCSSRTPILLDLRSPNAFNDPLALISMVRGELGKLPFRSLGHGMARFLTNDQVKGRLDVLPQSDVSFNFIGQTDRLSQTSSDLVPACESPGITRAASQIRALSIHVFADITEGRLRLVWKYSSGLHRPSTIEQLCNKSLSFVETFDSSAVIQTMPANLAG